MDYHEHAPCPDLGSHVECVWTLSSGAAPAPDNTGTILPDGACEIVLSVGDPIRISRALDAPVLTRMIIGQMERPWRLAYSGAVDVIGVRLWPWAPRSLLSCPPWTLNGMVTPLAMVAPRLDTRLKSAVTVDLDPGRRRSTVEAILTEAVADAATPDPVTVAAARLIRARNGSLRIHDVAQRLGVSERQLERKFVRDVGLSPKRWSRVIRFRLALEQAFNPREPAFAAVAQRLGYADQAHLTREFLQFAGQPPNRLRPRRAADPRPRRPRL
jgi:AraC-like DNA-binding protein